MEPEQRTELALEIRSMRKARGLKQSELAELASVGVRTIRNLEAGKPVSDGTLGQVVKALGYKPQTPRWPDDIQTFLDMIGFRLQRLDDEARAELIGEVTRAVIAPRGT